MKKQVKKTALFLMLLTASISFGQEKDTSDKRGSFKFGVKAGYANTNFAGDADTDAASNFYIGGLVDFSISEKLHIQPELLYSMEGSDEDELNLDFIRIPVMFKYFVGEGFNLQAGPQVAFVAGGGLVKDFTKSMDFGLGFGAAYELNSGLFFDARYNLGLTDLNDTGSPEKITTNSFQVGLGYRF